MYDISDEMIRSLPVRNTADQKKAFRDYACSVARKSGWQAKEDPIDKHVNVIIGEPERAKVIFCAHYDTPRRALFPNLMMPANTPLSVLYHFMPVLCMLIPALAAAYFASGLNGFRLDTIPDRLFLLAVYMIVYFGLFFVFLRGKPNRNNANDNTSGTAAVLTLLSKIAPCGQIAFILFDNEEKGKLGSKAYANAQPEIREHTLVINMDCVGNGETFLFCLSKAADQSPLARLLQDTAKDAKQPCVFFGNGKASMNSDHKNFKVSVGVCACKKKKFVGYYTPYIHTAKDTVYEPGNIENLTDILCDFTRSVQAS